jgi:hypothetical protein
MNLHNLAAAFRKLILPLITLGGAILFLVVGIFNLYQFQVKQNLRQLDLPETVAIEGTVNPSFQTAINTGYNQESLKSFPKNLAVYDATLKLPPKDQQTIATKLGFSSPSVKKDTVTTFTQNRNLLSYDENTNELTYTSAVGTDTRGPALSDDMVKQKAAEFLQFLGLASAEKGEETINYLSSGTHRGLTRREEAAVAALTFYPKVGDRLVISTETIVFNRSYQVVSFVLHPIQIGEESGNWPLKNSTELQQDIVSRQMKLLIKNNFDPDLDTNLFVSLSLDQVKIGYLPISESQKLIPAFWIGGRATFSKETVPVEVLIPALKGVGVR